MCDKFLVVRLGGHINTGLFRLWHVEKVLLFVKLLLDVGARSGLEKRVQGTLTLLFEGWDRSSLILVCLPLHPQGTVANLDHLLVVLDALKVHNKAVFKSLLGEFEGAVLFCILLVP